MRIGYWLPGFVLGAVAGLASPAAYGATVSFQVLNDEHMNTPVFAGRTTGEEGDIFWQGGDQDLDIIELPDVDVDTIGRNTLGSSSVTFAEFPDGRVRSYANAKTLYSGPIVFGLNSISTIRQQTEIQGFTNGLGTDVQEAGGLETVVFNLDNTFGYTNLRSENATHVFRSTIRHGYFLTAGQDPAVVFADSTLFANTDPLVTQ